MLGILIVGDIKLYTDGLRNLLAGDNRVHVLGIAASPEDALEAACVLDPALVLLDLSMANSIDLAKSLSADFPNTHIVAIGLRGVEEEIIRCAEAGVSGYVTRESSVGDLVKCILATANGELLCSPKIAGCLLRRLNELSQKKDELNRGAILTARERDIMGLIEEGQSNKQIARTLKIELSTVKNHVHHILTKLEVSSRGEAVALMRNSNVFV